MLEATDDIGGHSKTWVEPTADGAMAGCGFESFGLLFHHTLTVLLRPHCW